MKDRAFLVLATGAAIAAATAAFLPPMQAVAMLSGHTVPGGVAYVAGGLGKDPVDAIRSMQGGYNLRMTFARARTGGYLADIHVRIEDIHGNRVVAAMAPGLLFYARLPDATYRVLSTFGTQEQTRQGACQKFCV
ncbi:carboxypeptidase regulatory-like domain-containing protein [Cupriavidus numazuensis]|uniref:Uncharacterized protein n=1 Tax=Cupriavidus numazuensis TaxID=221992 RepID=A0ABN7QBB3_9BURK|nr:carboxypeptidase regulatory-like domain-containing protein [Cupriavidus numazuensis]CAG2160882.1 hypothetical protein LMG26411_07831 [Cupriavidus numazuensis]